MSSNTNDSSIPTRALNLQFAPIPDNGLNFAQQFVSAVKGIDNIILDYSIDTLDFVDNFLQRFSEEGLSVNDFAETIFVAGSYVGQVMVVNNKGKWVNPEGAGTDVSMMPLVIELPNHNIADPIAKAFKRFHYGKGENLKYFYGVFTSMNV